MIVRPATPDDVPQLHDMILELAEYERARDQVTATEEDLMKVLFGSGPSFSPSVFAHVIDGEGELAGMAIWFLNYSTWEGRHGIYLEDLYVRPHYRSRGMGSALMRELAEICIESDYSRFQWWVLDWNSPAIEVYRSMGAVAMDEWTTYRLTGEPLHTLAQRLPKN